MRPSTPVAARLSLAVLAVSAALATITAISCSSTATSAGGDAPDAGPPAKGTVETFVEMTTNSEGIAIAAGAEPRLYFTGGNAVWSATATGTLAKVADVPSPLGVAVRADGDLVVCGKAEGDAGESPGVLYRVTPAGARSVLVGPGGFKLTNFVAIAKGGALVFTDSAGNKVYRAAADGTGVALITDAIQYPNGLAFSPDGATLYVASWSTKKLYAIALAADGTARARAAEVYFEGVENVDGLVVESDGAILLVASGEGLVRVGTDRKALPVAPGSSFNLAANAAFGVGPYGQGWLYVTNLLGRHLSRVYVGTSGAPLPPR